MEVFEAAAHDADPYPLTHATAASGAWAACLATSCWEHSAAPCVPPPTQRVGKMEYFACRAAVHEVSPLRCSRPDVECLDMPVGSGDQDCVARRMASPGHSAVRSSQRQEHECELRVSSCVNSRMIAPTWFSATVNLRGALVSCSCGQGSVSELRAKFGKLEGERKS